MEIADNYARWLVSAFDGFFGTRILDVGFGHLGLRRHLPSGSAYVGLDSDPDTVERARRASPRDRFVLADLQDPELPSRLAAFQPLDTVFCCNILEHVADDARAVRTLLGLLEPGGHLLLFVPALPMLYNDLDRLAGHHRRYTRSRLRGLVPTEMAQIRKLRYFNPIGAVGWWANGLLEHRSLESRRVSRQVELFDRVLVPISAALDPISSSFFGQSLVCVLKKT